MTVRVLALASGVTSLESHRLGLAPIGTQAGVLNNRSGIYPPLTSADISTVSAMVAAISPFSAWVDGTSTSSQGGYSFTSDAAVNITFDAGNASTIRTDRVIARVKDNPYDGSGSQAGSVEYLKGNTSTGAATALPASSLLLWEVTVPVGASAGGGGINFSTQKVDKRVWTVSSGGVLPVGSDTDRSAITSPYAGFVISRTDKLWLEFYNGSGFKPVGIPTFTNAATRDAYFTGSAGDHAYLSTEKRMTVHNGVNWIYAPGEVLATYTRTTSSTATTSEVGVIRIDNIALPAGQSVEISTANLWLTGGTGDSVRSFIRANTAGVATTSSTVVPGAEAGVTIGNISYDETKGILAVYTAASAVTLSLLLTVVRAAGSGNASISGSADKIISMMVKTVGSMPTASGTSI